MRVFLFTAAFVLFLSIVSAKSRQWSSVNRQRNRQKKLKQIGPKVGPAPSIALKRRTIFIVKKKEKVIGQGDLKGITNSSPAAVGRKAEKKPIKKSDHYIDPRILEKLRHVHSIKDYVRVFSPKGFSLKKEVVYVKKNGDRTALSGGGHAKPVLPAVAAEFERKEETVVLYDGQKVADPAQDVSDTSCKPRESPLSLEELGKVSIPKCVMLKKCGGCCPASQECVVDTAVNKSVQVFEYSEATGFKYVVKSFVEHQTCKCDCIVKAEDCYPNQTYSQDHCQCECLRTPITCQAGKRWSKGECVCICSNRRVCKSRVRKWDEQNCLCACIDTPCSNGATRNKVTCKCPSVVLSDSTDVGQSTVPFTRLDEGKIDVPVIDEVFPDRADEQDSTDGADDDEFFGDF